MGRTAFWDVGDRPVWTEVTLAIADAIRNGEAVARVPFPMPISALRPCSPLISAWIDELGRDFTGIKIEPRDEDARAMSGEDNQKHGQRLIDEGRRVVQKTLGGGTHHATLDAYPGWIARKHVEVDGRVKAWGATQTRQVAFIKRQLPDVSLCEMGAARIET